MEKELKTIRSFDSLSYELYKDYLLSGIIECLTNLQKSGGTHFYLTKTGWGDDIDSIEIEISEKREETNEDFNKRVEAAEIYKINEKLRQERQERARYEELKKKFENKQ